MMYSIYGETDTGRLRSQNEDSIDWYLGSDGQSVLAVLADGVGGTAGGEIASRLAVEAVRSEAVNMMRTGADCEPGVILPQAIRIANNQVYARRLQAEELSQMATTIVAGIACGDRLVIAHIGDSRCYRLRGEQFDGLTRDDSLREQMIDEGVLEPAQTEGASFRHILTRTLGTQLDTVPQLQTTTTRPGDIYLFCSDGLNGMLDDTVIRDIIMTAENISRAASELIRQANAAGGEDNISVLLLQCM